MVFIGHRPNLNGILTVSKYETEEETKEPQCPVCKVDGGTIDSSVSHIADVLSGLEEEGEPYALAPMSDRTPGGWYRCTICRLSRFENEARLRIHLKDHMVQAHEGEKECSKCHQQFDTTARLFSHQRIHNVYSKDYHSGKKKECPHCHQEFKIPTYSNHITSCLRKSTNNLLFCDQCEYV